MLEAFPAVIVPSGSNAGLRARSLASSNFAGPSSADDHASSSLSSETSIGHDFGLENAGGDRLPGRVWLRTAKSSCSVRLNWYLSAHSLAAGSHVLSAINVPETVEDHRVEKLAVTEPIPFAGLGQQVGRARHAFHAAGHDQRGVAGANRLVGEHDGFQARAADLVDRDRADGIGQAGEDRCLAGGVLTQARPR